MQSQRRLASQLDVGKYMDLYPCRQSFRGCQRNYLQESPHVAAIWDVVVCVVGVSHLCLKSIMLVTRASASRPINHRCPNPEQFPRATHFHGTAAPAWLVGPLVLLPT